MSRASRLAISCLLLLALGCAVSREGRLGEVGTYDSVPSASPRPTGAVALSIRARVSGVDQEVLNEPLGEYEGPVFNAWLESGYFESVGTGFTPADVRAQVRVVVTWSHDSGSALLHFLTFGLWPHFQAKEYAVSTTFVDGAGRSLGTIEKAETVHYVDELFVSSAGMLTGPSRMEADTYADIQRATLIEAARRGWLTQTAARP